MTGDRRSNMSTSADNIKRKFIEQLRDTKSLDMPFAIGIDVNG